jgi:hypothetical protein
MVLLRVIPVSFDWIRLEIHVMNSLGNGSDPSGVNSYADRNRSEIIEGFD